MACTKISRATQVAGFVFVFVITAAQAAVATEPLLWDIGSEPSVSQPISPGEYRIVVRGRVRNAQYSTRVDVESIAVAPLAQVDTVPTPNATRDLLPADDPCTSAITDLTNLYESVRTAFETPNLASGSAEETFMVKRVAYSKTHDSLPAQCLHHASVEKLHRDFGAILTASEVDLGTVKLKKGQKLTVTVSRAQGNATRDFKFVRSTGARGNWVASAGFGIISNRDEHYFSRATDADTFEIARKRDNGGVDPTAAVFYTWLPTERETSDWNWGIAAGMGVDKTNLALFLGPHITFNQNVGLVVGVALHQETRLRGEFEVDQEIEESLTSDALEEKVNEVTWFVALTMRFGGE